MNDRSEMFLSPPAHLYAVVLATSRAYLKRFSAYLIELIRWPLSPLLMYATWRVTYEVSGRGQVDGAGVSGFLLVGIFGLITWTSTVWASGYAIMFERHEGTSGALFLSPASRGAVVAGYGLGSFIWFLPSFIAVMLLGLLTGAHLQVADALALVGAAVSLLAASLSVGFTLAGIFVLSRQGNLVANVVQQPIYLLAGFVVPLAALPPALRAVSNALPATHAIAALRQAALAGGTLHQTGREIALALAISLLYWLAGMALLRRVEYVAKRNGTLELY